MPMDPISTGAVVGALSNTKKAVEVFQKLQNAYENYREGHERQWWNKVLEKYPGSNPEEVAAEVESRFHKLETREGALKAVWHSYKTFMESVDDCVLPALASLTANYLALSKQPDFFFRGVCRILCEVNHREYESLKAILLDAVVRLKQYGAPVTKIKWWYDTANDSLKISLLLPNAPKVETRPVFENYERVMYLMDHNGLAERPPTVGGVSFAINVPLLNELYAVVK